MFRYDCWHSGLLETENVKIGFLFSGFLAGSEYSRGNADVLTENCAEMLRVFVTDLCRNGSDALVGADKKLLSVLYSPGDHIVFDCYPCFF